MHNSLYIRGLRHVKHTVFCVDKGQKTYYDPIAGRRVGYSSGQQVKRSILDAQCDAMDATRAHMTFRLEEDKGGSIKAAEVFSDCDPRHLDLLVGGWMRAVKGEEIVLKRRSPLSVSALTPLHGSLASVTDEVVTLDRRDDPEDAHTIEVIDGDGNPIEDIDTFFEEKERRPTRHQFTDRTNHKRITGLFEYTVAIDLTRLFQVPKRSVDPELAESMLEDLREAGWPEDENYFYLPKDQREKLAEALSRALIEWRVTSNQQRTFSLQNNLATVISKNAGAVANALYVRPNGESIKPVIEAFDGVDAYVTNQAAVFFPETDFEPMANDKAVARIEEELMARSDELSD